MFTRDQAEGIALFAILIGGLAFFGVLSWGTGVLAAFAGLWWTKWRQGASGRARAAQQSRNSWG